LPQIDEKQERPASKDPRAETPSAVQINTLTKIKSAELGSKQKVQSYNEVSDVN
jgi:hypothetical protein